MNKSTIGNFIKNYRKENGLSLRRLSEITGLSFTHLGNIERGKYIPSHSSLSTFALRLKIDPIELLLLAGYAPNEGDYSNNHDYIIRYETRYYLIFDEIVRRRRQSNVTYEQIANCLKMSIEEYKEIENVFLNPDTEGNLIYPLPERSESPFNEVNEETINMLTGFFETDRVYLVNPIDFPVYGQFPPDVLEEMHNRATKETIELRSNILVCNEAKIELTVNEAVFLKESLVTFRKFQSNN